MMLMPKNKIRRIPTGRVFKRKYRDRNGKQILTRTWFLKYYSGGKPVEVSTGTENYEKALAQLRKKMAAVNKFGSHRNQPERVRIAHLLDLLIESYKFKKNRSLSDTEARVDKHLRPAFGDTLASELSSGSIRAYAKKRIKEASDATVNKELAWLRAAMRLGLREDPPLVERVPHFQLFELDNARDGIISHETYRTVRDLLPSHARIALVIGYHTGARKGEITSILREHIDLSNRRILRPGRATKNKKPRYLPIYGDMRAELDMALSKMKNGCQYLIQDHGKRVSDFRKAWASACELAGVEGVIFHDLRRTALTNMIEAGISEREAMEISGHKTRAVFDRYHIVSARRLQQMGSKMDEHLKAKEVSAKPESAALPS